MVARFIKIIQNPALSGMDPLGRAAVMSCPRSLLGHHNPLLLTMKNDKHKLR